jgi:N-acetylneuraminic acid mutarotase
MGKKKGKKVDVEKKSALQAKKEAKQEKAAQKRLSKQQLSDGNDDGSTTSDLVIIDQVLQAYKNQKEKTGLQNGKPTLENLSTAFPLPRANATLEHGADDKNRDFLYLFGGEYFDGIENIVLDELLRFDCRKREWKQILTLPPRPSPRCAHSCVAYKSSLFVFGGEMATADAYHHYRDLWKFDFNALQWIEITAKNPPSARSGHACFVWKHFMILIGGFFEASRETKWYNDVHVFNLQTETWMDVPQSRLSMKPEPRSACNWALYGVDKAIIHGGFAKLKSPNASATDETKVHTDAWILHLAPLLQQKPPTWERWITSSKTLSSSSPNGRAGTSCISYKNRMLVFGGVVDQEQQHHKVNSTFYNDLMAMDVDRRKWFPLRVNDKCSGGRGRRRQRQDRDLDEAVAPSGGDAETNDEKAQEENDSASELEEDDGEGHDSGKEHTGWNLDMLRSNMFAFIDGDGNIVYEKFDADESKEVSDLDEVKEDEEDEEEEEFKAEEEEQEKANEEEKVEKEDLPGLVPQVDHPSLGHKMVTSSSVMILNERTNTTEAVARSNPLPRINGAIVLHGHTMYMHGGILEVGDREVTLDDMWALDLRKRDKWECLWPGTMHKQVWRGAIHDDDDSYVSTGKEDDSEEDDDEQEEDDLMDRNCERSGTSKQNRAILRKEMAELNRRYGLEDKNRTPNLGESLADFCSRTSDYWNARVLDEKAVIGTALSNKELKRQGFALAKKRFEELEPVLRRLAELSIGRGEDKQTDSMSPSDKVKKTRKSGKR